MKDNQIIQENWFQAMTRKAGEDFGKLTIRKPVVKHIPIEVWHSLTPGSISPEVQEWRKLAPTPPYEIRNSGGRTYLVTKQEKL